MNNLSRQTKLAIFSLAMALITSQSQAVLITGFGTSDFLIDGSTTWTTSQNSSSVTASGSDFSNSLSGGFAAVNISGMGVIQFSASLSQNPGTNFVIAFFDGEFDQLTYQGTFSNYSIVTSTSSLVFVSASPTFDFTNVIGLTLFSAGAPPGAPINLTLDSLSAVPEPTTMALLAGSLTAIMVLRRRRAS